VSPLREFIARSAGDLSRRLGRGGGTTLPGRILLRLDPSALERLGSELTEGSILVSATNGKTTTSTMLATILEETGHSVTANSAGSNMPWGIVTALLDRSEGVGLFEVDEAWLPSVARSLDPTAIILGNLFRDQLDRYGETESIASRWIEMASGSAATLVVNADDPLVCSVGDVALGDRLNYGIEDRKVSLDEPDHARDAKQCRSCGETLHFEASFIGHLGHWICPSCGLTRPAPDIYASDVELKGMTGLSARVTAPDGEALLSLPVPGLYNLYNALGAIAGASALGIGVERSVRALRRVKAVFGRVERIELAGKGVAILLIKNPVGANEVLRALSGESDKLNLWLALNDRIADGRDVSWIWDADFERLAEGVNVVVCSGTRAPELALRLKYAGFPPDSVKVWPDIGESFDRILDEVDGELFALPTYTALLELKEHLSQRWGLDNYWENRSEV
jgi:UDP-N-acetylmuramyl tripeptide synthase